MVENSQHPPFDLFPDWLTASEVISLWPHLLALPWQDEYLTLFGRRQRMPRQVVWIADAGMHYRYAHQDHMPHPWTDALLKLRMRLQQTLAVDFNGVLGNYYHHGQDYMGWHSDDEPSISQAHPIVSLSLGAARRFKFRAKKAHRIVTDVWLPTGSLLVMHPGMQHAWQHTLPKMTQLMEPRINLTFRVVCLTSK